MFKLFFYLFIIICLTLVSVVSSLLQVSVISLFDIKHLLKEIYEREQNKMANLAKRVDELENEVREIIKEKDAKLRHHCLILLLGKR